MEYYKKHKDTIINTSMIILSLGAISYFIYDSWYEIPQHLTDDKIVFLWNEIY